MKRCKQCGELRPEDQYRKYYGGRKGSYKTCKTCEKINGRAKYLRRKGDDRSSAESNELERIEKLYDAQRAAGLQPPCAGGSHMTVASSVDDMLSKFNCHTDASGRTVAAPPELSRWLTEPLTEEPDFYTDEVYDELTAKYRPVLRLDNDMSPVYDDTYKDILEQIISRFYEYEESYWRDKSE